MSWLRFGYVWDGEGACYPNPVVGRFACKPSGLITEMSQRGSSKSSESRPESHVIKVRGLPYEAVALDLCKFFQDCKIKGGPRGIYFCLNSRDLPTGEVYIQMESPRDVNNALRKHKDRMGGRYLEIFESSKGILERVIKEGATNERGFNEKRLDRPRLQSGGLESGGGGITWLSGMSPWEMLGSPRDPTRDYFRERERELLRDLELLRERERELRERDLMARDFRDRYRDRERDRDFLDTRGRDSFRPRTGDRPRRDRSIDERSRSRDRGQPRNEASDYCVKLRGLPWSATKDEIAEFLGRCNILRGNDGIIILLNNRNQPSGDAFVEVETEEDVDVALKQHKKNIGERYVEVFKASPKQVARAKDKLEEDVGKGRNSGFTVTLRGLPYSCSEREVMDWLSDAGEPSDVKIGIDRLGRPSGTAVAYFKSEKEAKSVARAMHKRDLGHRYIECFYDE